jgi:hypothetical protein
MMMTTTTTTCSCVTKLTSEKKIEDRVGGRKNEQVSVSFIKLLWIMVDVSSRLDCVLILSSCFSNRLLAILSNAQIYIYLSNIFSYTNYSNVYYRIVLAIGHNLFA